MNETLEFRLSRFRYVVIMSSIGTLAGILGPLIAGRGHVDPQQVAITATAWLLVSIFMPLGNRAVCLHATQLTGPDTGWIWIKPVSVSLGLIDLAASRMVTFGKSYLAIKGGGRIHLDPSLMGRERCRLLLREIEQRQASLRG